MDFAALPPEVNSTLIYTGPGAAPMMAAATAWNGLGAELSSTASVYQSVITTLSTEEWLGPASTAMAAAITPYVAWLNTTAAAAERAGVQAVASSAAYEEAFAMTVPPPVIAANRAALAALTATNILGQNTPAIAVNEARYAEMWAQDAGAMYGYATASAGAAVLNPLTPPASPVNPAGPAGQGAAVAHAALSDAGLSQLVTTLPTTVQGLSRPASGSSGLFGLGSVLSDAINSTQNIGLWNALQTYSGAAGNIVAWNLFGGITSAIGVTQAGEAGALTGTAGSTGSAGMVLVDDDATAAVAAPPVSASLGEAYTVDGLSIPTSWAVAVPGDVDVVTLAGADGPLDGLTGAAPTGSYGLAAISLASLAPLTLRARPPAAVAPESRRPRVKKRRAGRIRRKS